MNLNIKKIDHDLYTGRVEGTDVKGSVRINKKGKWEVEVMGKITHDRYISGTHNVISDRSGQKYKRKDMKFEWNGLLVGKDEWARKQPQLTIRGRQEQIAVTDGTRTQGEDPPLLDPPITPSQFL